MEKFKQFLVAIIAMLLFFFLVGGSICTQVILWQTAWYIALMHLVLVGFAVRPAIDTFRNLIKYIS